MTLVLIAFLVAVLSGSANPIFIRFATQEIPPITFSAVRFLLAASVLFIIWRRQKEIIVFKDLFKLLPYTANMGLYAVGIQYTSATMGAVLYTLAPILTAILGYLMLQERLSRVHILGTAVAIFGTVLLIAGSFETRDIFTFGMPLGNVLIFLAVCSWGFYPSGARSLSKTYATTTILFYNFALTGILFLLAAPIEWMIRPVIISDISYITAITIIGAAFVGTVLFYFCYQWLIKHTTAFIASIHIYLGFMVTSFYGAIFLGEHFTARLAVGSFFVLLGVFVATTYTQLKRRM